jgi:hypothetical protein
MCGGIALTPAARPHSSTLSPRSAANNPSTSTAAQPSASASIPADSAHSEESALDEARAMGVLHVAAATPAVDLSAKWIEEIASDPERFARLSAKDVIRMLEVGVKIERLARGLPTDRVESKNEPTVQADARSAEIDGLSFEDLMADPVMRRVLAELDREQADASNEDDGPWVAEKRRERNRAV